MGLKRFFFGVGEDETISIDHVEMYVFRFSIHGKTPSICQMQTTQSYRINVHKKNTSSKNMELIFKNGNG